MHTSHWNTRIAVALLLGVGFGVFVLGRLGDLETWVRCAATCKCLQTRLGFIGAIGLDEEVVPDREVVRERLPNPGSVPSCQHAAGVGVRV